MKNWFRRQIKLLKLLFIRKLSKDKRELAREKRKSDISTNKNSIRTDLMLGDRLKEISLLPEDREILYHLPSYNELMRLHKLYRGIRESDHPSVNTKTFSTRH